MSNKSRRKRVGIGLMVVATCIVVAGLWAALATPETALAKKPVKPPGGGGEGTTIYFDVLLGVDGQDIFMVSGSGTEGRIESIGGGTNIDRMIVNRPSPHIDITSVISVVDPSGTTGCFDDLLDGLRYIGVKGTLLIELPDRTVEVMTVAYSFRAKDKKGKDVYYTIRTTGMLDLDDEWGGVSEWIAVQDAVNDGTANPDDIPDFFVQVDGGTPWTLSKTDGSQKFACTGNGTFESGFGILIIDPRVDMKNNKLLCP